MVKGLFDAFIDGMLDSSKDKKEKYDKDNYEPWNFEEEELEEDDYYYEDDEEF